ncbi:MAG: hypothetical protein U0795_00925 [Pirellulales bacterium]
MSKAFDLRKQLKLHDKGLLCRLFEGQREMADVPWETLRPHDVEPIVRAWETLGDGRRRFQVVLQDVQELTDPRAQRVLLEVFEYRCPDKLSELQKLSSPADRALWAYLDARDAFEEALLFGRAEAMRTGQYANRWNSLPKQPVDVTPEKLADLEKALTGFYWGRELRGEICRVHHYSRAGGSEFFFSYLPDWPDKQLTFDNEENLIPTDERRTFTNVFVYEPDSGAVELIAKGGRKVHSPLRKAFCRALLGLDVEDAPPLKPAYQLDHLLKPEFEFPTDPQDRIAEVRLRRLRIFPRRTSPLLEYVEFKFAGQAARLDGLSAVYRTLMELGLGTDQVTVSHAGIQVQFLGDSERRSRTMMFTIAAPSSCDLKSKSDDDRLVGEKCLRQWGILSA